MDLKSDDVKVEFSQHVAWLKFEAVADGNGLTMENMDDILAVLDACEANKNLKAIVISGAAKTFCIGGAMSLLQKMSESDDAYKRSVLNKGQKIIKSLSSLPLKVVGDIQGLVAGAGFDLVLAFDLILWGPAARVNYSFNKMNLIPDLGGLFLLEECLGRAGALAFYSDSRTWKAEDLVNLGLGEMHSRDIADVQSWEESLRSRLRTSREAFGVAKQSLWELHKSRYERYLDVVNDKNVELLKTDLHLQMLTRTLAVQKVVSKNH